MSNDQLHGPPQIEPMSDVAWARIERGMWAQLDLGAAPTTVTQRRWVWFVAPALAAAAAVVLALFALREGPSPTVPTPAPLAAAEPARMVSGDAPASITFADAHVALDAQSAVSLAHEGASPVTVLERGGAWFTVAPRGDRPAFLVRAGDATIRVIGTRFRVARSDERVTVAVDHGLVEVVFRGSTARIAGSQQWSSLEPDQVTPIEPVRAPLPATSTATATATTTTATANLPPATHDGHGAHEAPPVEDLDRTAYDRFSSIEARDPETALAGYLRLSRGSGPWAEVALFAAGRLAADRHDRRAQALLTIYLRRFPAGANTADARQLLERLHGAHP